MNLFDDTDNIIMNIDGKDIEMKPAICFDKVYDKWLVSKYGTVYSLYRNRFLTGKINYRYGKNKKYIIQRQLTLSTPLGFWEDGSGNICGKRNTLDRKISFHKVVMDTWKPLYNNPPDDICWEEWEIVRDLPDTFDHISKTVVIDHIDNNPLNNHLDNLRRINQWTNNPHIKSKGL